nr:hypothetical protein [Gammaproteobacteria bacterium]
EPILAMESLLEEPAVGLAHRRANNAPAKIAQADLVLAAEGKRPSRDLGAPGLEGAPLVFALREPLAEIAILGLLRLC